MGSSPLQDMVFKTHVSRQDPLSHGGRDFKYEISIIIGKGTVHVHVTEIRHLSFVKLVPEYDRSLLRKFTKIGFHHLNI